MTYVKKWAGFIKPVRLSKAFSLLCLLVLCLVPAEFSYSANNSCSVQQHLLTMLRSEVELLRQDYQALLTIIESLEGKSTNLDVELATLRRLSTRRLNRITELESLVTASQEMFNKSQTKLHEVEIDSHELTQSSTKLRLNLDLANATLKSSTPKWVCAASFVGGVALGVVFE